MHYDQKTTSTLKSMVVIFAVQNVLIQTYLVSQTTVPVTESQ
jgi:hypothetical protein